MLFSTLTSYSKTSLLKVGDNVPLLNLSDFKYELLKASSLFTSTVYVEVAPSFVTTTILILFEPSSNEIKELFLPLFTTTPSTLIVEELSIEVGVNAIEVVAVGTDIV